MPSIIVVVVVTEVQSSYAIRSFPGPYTITLCYLSLRDIKPPQNKFKLCLKKAVMCHCATAMNLLKLLEIVWPSNKTALRQEALS